MRMPAGYSSWLLTINSPIEAGLNHAAIKEKLFEISSLFYFCMADEIGLEQAREHTHVFFACNNQVSFYNIKELFPTSHINKAKASAFQNKEYIQKANKWENTDKAKTRVENTFQEWGIICPDSPHVVRLGLAVVYSWIEQGLSNYDILGRNKEYILILPEIQQLREAYSREKENAVSI